MNLNENIYRIKQLMGVLSENNSEIDPNWLYNWFSEVPEEKLQKTFSQTDANGIIITQKPVDRNEILKVIKNVEIIKMNYNDLPIIVKIVIGTPLGTYQPQKPDSWFEQNKKISTEMWNAKENQALVKKLEEKGYTLEKSVQEIQDYFKKTNGKIVIFSEDGFVLPHEQTHAVFELVPNNIDQIISSICKPCLNDYHSKKTEIYSFLMTFRGQMGLKPYDVITKVKVNRPKKEPSHYDVKVVVNRNNRRVVLKKTYTNSLPMQVFVCCGSENLEKVIMQLHNDLAKNNNNTNNHNMV